MGGPEYEALAGGETKNLKIARRKLNNPPFPPIFEYVIKKKLLSLLYFHLS